MPNQPVQATPIPEVVSVDTYIYSLAGAAILFAICFADQGMYLFSHGFVELFSIVMMLTVCVIIWNARKHLTNEYLLFVGFSFIFIAALDLTRTLLYGAVDPATGVLETNITAQLWIAARAFQAGVLVAASFFIGKKMRLTTFLTFSVAIIILIIFSIFYWPVFPTSYLPGVGPTLFKTLSEYIISVLFFAAFILLGKRRASFEKGVFYLVRSFLFISLLSELFFAFGMDTQAPLNPLGHLLGAIAFYL